MRTAKVYVVYRADIFGPRYWDGTGYATRDIALAQRLTLRQAKARRDRIDRQDRGLYGYTQAPGA